jgi:hypothetical protein
MLLCFHIYLCVQVAIVDGVIAIQLLAGNPLQDALGRAVCQHAGVDPMGETLSPALQHGDWWYGQH